MEHNKTVNNEQNWLCKLKEFEELPVSWQSGKLTFFWKMPAYNFFIHKILYMSTILKTFEQSFVKGIYKKKMVSFIWGNREQMKGNSFIRNIDEGGIGITYLN